MEELVEEFGRFRKDAFPARHASALGCGAPGSSTDHRVSSGRLTATPKTRGRYSSARLGRRTTPSVRIIGIAAIALLGSANTFANAAENSSRMALEHHACAVVMGLHQPGDLYDTCIRSLDKSLSKLDQTRRASTDRGTCAQQGLKPGTPAFAVCVVDAEQSPAGPGRYKAIVPVR
jgi:hypothetical protein